MTLPFRKRGNYPVSRMEIPIVVPAISILSLFFGSIGSPDCVPAPFTSQDPSIGVRA